MAERRHDGRHGDARVGYRGGGRGDLPNDEAARQRDLRDIENDDLRYQVRDLQRRIARLEERRGKSNPMSSTAPERRSLDDPLFTDVCGGLPKSRIDEQIRDINKLSVFDCDSIFTSSDAVESPTNSYTNIASMPVYDKPVYDEDIFDAYDEDIFEKAKNWEKTSSLDGEQYGALFVEEELPADDSDLIQKVEAAGEVDFGGIYGGMDYSMIGLFASSISSSFGKANSENKDSSTQSLSSVSLGTWVRGSRELRESESSIPIEGEMLYVADVYSPSVAKFTPQEVSALQGGGNARGKEIYLNEWDSQRNSLPDGSNIDGLRDFIKHVYVDRRFTGEENVGDDNVYQMGVNTKEQANGDEVDSRSSLFQEGEYDAILEKKIWLFFEYYLFPS